jgi:hypothetical protein
MIPLDDLYKRFVGQTGWIIGKRPSLLHLRATHIDSGPVIALNESIKIVEGLDLPNFLNPLFSIQKDGCQVLAEHQECAASSPMVKPALGSTHLLLSAAHSPHCMASHPLRTVFEERRLGDVAGQAATCGNEMVAIGGLPTDTYIGQRHAIVPILTSHDQWWEPQQDGSLKTFDLGLNRLA